MTVLFVIGGALLGAPLRYLTDRFVQARHRSAMPWGTWVVNVSGSFILGTIAAIPMRGWALALLGTGFCGALTTYSTFGYETVRLWEMKKFVHAQVYLVSSIAVGLVAATAGAALVMVLR